MLINMPEGQWSTMNFTPFTGPFTGSIPVHQFTAKFANASGQTTAVPPGTVVVSGGDGGIHYLRPHELVSQGTTLSNQTLITVPVNVGKYARLAEVQTTQTSQSQQQQTGTTTVQAQGLQQTATVQVLNHGGIKYNVTPVSMQQFSQMTSPVGATVLTVAYPADLDGSGDGKQQTQCFPVEIQAQDLCATLVVSAPSVTTSENDKGTQIKEVIIKREDGNDKEDRTAVTTAGTSEIDFQGQPVTTAMPATWQSLATPGSTVADYLARLPASTLPLSLHHFLKFSAESIKKENSEACTVTLPPAHQPIVVTTAAETEPEITESVPEEEGEGAAGTTKTKKKKKGKKAVKQPRMRPGQVQLTTALDGTTLFCCPECHMAYPDKDLLEQHLVAHKIERRFICDICGAGLKRKEHLDRHKQGHNPERPFICSVCMKGFKRKEHLNLHFVIHSGEKTHVCPECGKGFYRKDHLRKHSRSHLAKRVKNEMNDQIKITNILQQVSAEATSTDDPLKLIP